MQELIDANRDALLNDYIGPYTPDTVRTIHRWLFLQNHEYAMNNLHAVLKNSGAKYTIYWSTSDDAIATRDGYTWEYKLAFGEHEEVVILIPSSDDMGYLLVDRHCAAYCKPAFPHRDFHKILNKVTEAFLAYDPPPLRVLTEIVKGLAADLFRSIKERFQGKQA